MVFRPSHKQLMSATKSKIGYSYMIIIRTTGDEKPQTQLKVLPVPKGA